MSGLPDTAETVIIGAGCVGCSSAYHLTEQGREDIVVVEQGPLFETGGSTSHAPGLVFQTASGKLMTNMAQYTRELYYDLDCYRRSGGIEVAYTSDRWDFLKRKCENGLGYGIEGGKLLSPAEVKERIPIVDEGTIHGGYYVPTDGTADAVDASEKMAEMAMDVGAEFYGHTTVRDIETSRAGVEAVVTDAGRIEADEVLVATNIWGPLFGEMVGVDIPLAPCAHQYLVSEELDELRGAEREVEQPILRHQDYSMYFRQHGERYGIGSYNHEPLLVDPEDILDPEAAPEMPSIREFTEEHFYEPTHPDIDKPAHEAATELVPALEGANFNYRINGMFSFTPDGMPIVGETETIPGLWWALAVWVTQSGGVGNIVAEWMENGTPKLDGDRANVTGVHIDRFQPHSGSREYVRDRAGQQYQEVYQLIHPREQPRNQRGLRRSPFYRHQADLDAEFYESGGWESPQRYGANADLVEEYDVPSRDGWLAQNWSQIEGAEHLAVRDRVGVYDLTSFNGIGVSGDGAEAFLQRLFTNDIDIDVGQVRYTAMVNEAGGVLGDLTVTRQGENDYLVLTGGGSSGTEHIRWIRDHVPDDGSVTITNKVSEHCGLGLWGPEAREVLESVTDADVSGKGFGYFQSKRLSVGSVPATALRVSYVGELGWELWAPMEYGQKLWETVWDAGREHGIVALGDGALNSMRLEKGFRLYGTDITPEYGPFEAGIGFAVDLEKGDFVGRDALVDAAAGVDTKIACLTLDDHGAVVDAGKPVLDPDGDERLGYLCSADYGYTVGRGIGYAYLPTAYADAGTDVQVQFEGERYDATVRDEPLFDPGRDKILR